MLLACCCCCCCLPVIVKKDKKKKKKKKNANFDDTATRSRTRNLVTVLWKNFMTNLSSLRSRQHADYDSDSDSSTFTYITSDFPER
jgi:hypothetical protein